MPSYIPNPDAERLLEHQIARRREKLYNKAVRLRDRNNVRFSQRITKDMPLHELEHEINLAERNRKIDRNVNFMKYGTLGVTKMLEKGVKKSALKEYVNLDGWHAQIRRDIYEIGEIYEDLHEEHEEALDRLGSPWSKLAFIIFGSAATIAFTNSSAANTSQIDNHTVDDNDDNDDNDDEFDDLMNEAENL